MKFQRCSDTHKGAKIFGLREAVSRVALGNAGNGGHEVSLADTLARTIGMLSRLLEQLHRSGALDGSAVVRVLGGEFVAVADPEDIDIPRKQ